MTAQCTVDDCNPKSPFNVRDVTRTQEMEGTLIYAEIIILKLNLLSLPLVILIY
jgi:hypothetical protein